MIKILIVSVGKLSGGIEKYTLMLERYMHNEECEIHFAVRSNSWLSKKIKGNHVISLKMDKYHIWKSMIDLKNYVKDNDINIVQCNNNNALFVSQLIRGNSVRKKVAVVHGDVLVDQLGKGRIIASIYKNLEIKMIKKTNGCIAVSESMKRILIERGVDEQFIEVVYNGVKNSKYDKKKNYDSIPLTICSVGNLLPVKNYIFLLKSLHLLKVKYPEVLFRCDIYGEGSERKTLEEYIVKNDLREVYLMGFEPNMENKLEHYILYIQPSLYESFGIAVIESMVSGCCAAVSYVGGMTEIVNNHRGFVFGLENCEELTEIIYYCYCNRDQIRKKAFEGEKYARAYFSVEHMITQTFDYYKKILGGQCEN